MRGKAVKETRREVSNAAMASNANPVGNVNDGVIMKHIGNTGGVVALHHSRRFSVTASVDRIDFHNPAYIEDPPLI